MANILLAGFGKLANHLAPKLLQQNHHVWGVNRSGSITEPVLQGAPQFQMLTGQLGQRSTSLCLAEKIDIAIITLTPDSFSDAAYQHCYIDGVNALLKIFNTNQQSPRILFVSSTRVYGQNQGEWVSEQSETIPNSEKGNILLAAEKLILNQTARNHIVRFSGIYGNNRNRFIQSVKQGDSFQKHPPHYTNRIHQEDCVGVLELLVNKLLHNQELEPIYLCSDDEPAPIYDVASWIAHQLDRPVPNIKKSSGTIQNKRCLNTAIKQLGYRFKYPSYKNGYATVLKSDY